MKPVTWFTRLRVHRIVIHLSEQGPLQAINLWGVSPLYENESLKEVSLPTVTPIDKLLDEGNCVRVTDRGKVVVQPTEEGAPQGGPLSPLLSNILSIILLDDLDKELERRRLKFVRHVDDFLVFVKSSRSAECVFRSVQRYLKRTLKLDEQRVLSVAQLGYQRAPLRRTA